MRLSGEFGRGEGVVLAQLLTRLTDVWAASKCAELTAVVHHIVEYIAFQVITASDIHHQLSKNTKSLDWQLAT